MACLASPLGPEQFILAPTMNSQPTSPSQRPAVIGHPPQEVMEGLISCCFLNMPFGGLTLDPKWIISMFSQPPTSMPPTGARSVQPPLPPAHHISSDTIFSTNLDLTPKKLSRLTSTENQSLALSKLLYWPQRLVDKKELASCCSGWEVGVGSGEQNYGFLMSHAVIKGQLCTQSHSPTHTCSTQIYSCRKCGGLRVKGFNLRSVPQLAL